MQFALQQKQEAVRTHLALHACIQAHADVNICLLWQVPDHTMAILLGLGFCVVAPLIAPIALLYFLICTLIGKYQMVYVFTPSFQSGGRVSLPAVCVPSGVTHS